MEYQKIINDKLYSLSQYFDLKIDIKSKNAIVTFFVYKNITKDLKNTLRLFIMSNLKFNNHATIYIFTNHIDLEKDFQNEKVVFLFFPELDKEVVTNRVVFNYYAIKLFLSYTQLYILDTDLIPLKPYINAFKFNYDVGLTISNEWFKYNKFPINGGFFMCNNANQKNINDFRKDYLNSYDKVLKLENQILDLKLVDHKSKPFSEWWGDQYIYFIMFNFNFPKDVIDFSDLKKNKLTFRFFNEWNYNLQSADLKYADTSFNVGNFIKNLSNVFFIHLKGKNKRFASDLYEILLK